MAFNNPAVAFSSLIDMGDLPNFDLVNVLSMAPMPTGWVYVMATAKSDEDCPEIANIWPVLYHGVLRIMAREGNPDKNITTVEVYGLIANNGMIDWAEADTLVIINYGEYCNLCKQMETNPLSFLGYWQTILVGDSPYFWESELTR